MMSTSQKGLRVLIAAPSVGLALLTVLVAPRGTLVAAVVLIVLTPFVVLDPASRLTTLLLALHGVNWLSSTVVPATVRDWFLTLFAALAVMTIHLAAALCAALPPAAPLPRATVRRWLRRGLTVAGLSVPVWALLVAQTAGSPAGEPLITYAALASLAIVALAFWLAQRDHPSAAASSSHSSPRGPGTR